MLDFLDETGDLDDTLWSCCSPTTASSEGGPTGSLNDLGRGTCAARRVDEALDRIDDIGGPCIHNNYPWGWTVAGNTPFRRWKREVHEGGVADPLIVHWPRRIAEPGEVRRQYVHAIDVLPTMLDARGGRAAAEPSAACADADRGRWTSPPTFVDPDAPRARAAAVLRDVRLPGACTATAGRR